MARLRRFRPLLALVTVLAGCPRPPELVEPRGLVDDAELALHTEGAETRPAIRLSDEAPLRWNAPAAGTLRFGLAPAGAGGGSPVVRVRISDGRIHEVGLARAGAWQDHELPEPVASGDRIAFELAGSRGAWLADPRVEAPRPSPPGAPLVVLVLVDTLRADHTSLDGYPLATSPHLTELAADGTAFRRAYAPAPWTRPSAASLLTGLSAERHHVLDRGDRLRDEIVTLAEIARHEGYRTVALATNPNVVVGWGFGQGFARFVDLGAGRWAKRKPEAREVYDRALAILDAESLPAFLFLHVLDPHHPYAPPLEIARRLHPDFRELEPGQELPERPSPEQLRHAVRRYDGEILDADHALGRFLAGLRERGLYEDAAIVVTADHGEEFGERGGRYHGHTLYEEQLRVPLVVKLPGVAATNGTDALASLEDVLPTLGEALAWRIPETSQGRSLLPAIRGEGPVRDAVHAATRLDDAHAYAIITPDRKLIRRLAPRPANLLFDLASDPDEQMPRDQPEELAALGARIDRAIAQDRAGWHVRACGGAERRELRIRVHGALDEPRAIGFEAEDALEPADGAWSMRVFVGRRREWGAAASRPATPDEDEIVFPSDAVTLVAEAGGPPGRDAGPADPGHGPELWVAGALQPWSGATTLEPEAARRPSLGPPACPGGDRPAILVWHVAAPAVDQAVPDDALRRRLEALGYLVDEAPGGSP